MRDAHDYLYLCIYEVDDASEELGDSLLQLLRCIRPGSILCAADQIVCIALSGSAAIRGNGTIN